MTNKPMLSVERELLERAASAIEKHHGSLQWVIASDLRALLDKPVLESQYEGMTQDQAQAVSDGVDEILHGEPAAHKQPAPVYQVCDGVNGWIDVDLLRYTACCLDPEEYECRVLYAEQPAPLAVDAEILERFPEINFANYGQEEVEALQAWAFEAYEAIARLNGVKP